MINSTSRDPPHQQLVTNRSSLGSNPYYKLLLVAVTLIWLMIKSNWPIKNLIMFLSLNFKQIHPIII
jgi:hypothetical protein